jgi:hypothetical protein
MTSANNQSLVDRIRAVFGRLSPPGLDRLCSPPVTEDGEDLIADFGGKHWSELPIPTVFYNRAGLSSLSPEGFRFYLPAFMTASLTATSEEGRGDISQYTMWSLAPDPESASRFQERISLLTDEEREVVREFLAALAARWPAWGSAMTAWTKDP